MKRFLRWLLGRDLRHAKGDPSACPACQQPEPPKMFFGSGDVNAIPDDGRRYQVLPQVFECDCGRQHPAGWICACSSRGEL